MARCVYCGKPATGVHHACPEHIHLMQTAPQARSPKWELPKRAMTKGHSSPSLGRRSARGR